MNDNIFNNHAGFFCIPRRSRGCKNSDKARENPRDLDSHINIMFFGGKLSHLQMEAGEGCRGI